MFNVFILGSEFKYGLDCPDHRLSDPESYGPRCKPISKMDNGHIYVGGTPINFSTEEEASAAGEKYLDIYGKHSGPYVIRAL